MSPIRMLRYSNLQMKGKKDRKILYFNITLQIKYIFIFDLLLFVLHATV